MKLFIYIPTYRRPQALISQLKVLLPQVSKHPQVRVIINENDGYVEGSDLAKRMCKDAENITFYRNLGNIGGNANISLGFVFARPNEFLWILSDNDLITDSSIEYVLSKLDPKIDFIAMRNDVTQTADIVHEWTSGFQPIMDWRMGLISDGIYNCNTIKDFIDLSFFYHNSSFPHLAVIAGVLKGLGEARFRFIPRDRIHSELLESNEYKTDYFVAHAGMVQLSFLMPEIERDIFLGNWLIKHGNEFFRSRNEYPYVFSSSIGTIYEIGSNRVKVILFLTRILNTFLRPIYSNKGFLKNIANKYLPVFMIHKLRNLGRWL